MGTGLAILVGSIAALALLAYAGFLAARYFFVPRFPDEIHFASASDGWRLAVVRYRPAPANGTPVRPSPVLLIHGLGANRYNLDLTDELSLARFLAARGHD